MKTKAQLEAEIRPLQAALHRIRDAETKAEFLALVGKHFKYHNSYSSDRPQWWLYAKVIRVGEFHPVAFVFQTDCDGRSEVKTKEWFTASHGYIEIAAKEFNAEWRKVQKRIAGMKP